MSVLIKGMKMPTEGKVMAIYKLKEEFYATVNGTELCPLIELPDHGRLIDADKKMTDLISRQAAIKAIDDLPNCYNGYSDTYDKAYIIGVLEELPTIDPIREVVCPNCGAKTVIVYACEGSMDETD